uniref:Putative ribonuclease H-like domain-containing protein n=1 Tax=Tanacetum cinerariifolium TaxID=118510 RepID=A0A6L2MRQ5_TANCI|nr:putative ribonuclease H-like domain-containing protein [Tanacetum cinerariifolium]
MTEYSLWEVILNGDSLAPTRVVEGVLQPVTPTTVEQKLARKNELKARGTLLMALPDKHQLKFNSYKVAKTLMEAIEKRNKADLEEQSLDDLFNSLKIYKAEVKHSSSTGTTTQNLDFVSYSNTNSTTESVIAAASVSAICAKMHVSSLPNVDSLSNIDVNDLEEMNLRWQMAMLTMRVRRFLQKTGRNLGPNGPTSMGFDMSKEVMTGFQAKEEPANYTLMAFSSSSSSFDNEVVSCSKACSKAYAQLHSQYDKLTADFGKLKFAVISYQIGFESVEARLLVYKQNEFGFEEDIKLLKLEVQLRDNALVTLRQKLEKAEQERDDLKLKLEKFQTSFKSLTELLAKSDESCPLVLFVIGSNSVIVATPKLASPKPTSNGKRRNRKVCFVCKFLDHLIKDCDYHAKKMAQPIVRNHAHRVLTQSKPVHITVVRPVSAAVPKLKVTRPSHATPIVTKSNSPTRRHITRSPSPKVSNSPPRVTVVKAPVVNATQDLQGKWEWRPKCPILDHGNLQYALKDKRVIDSGCLRYMIGNMSYISGFEELNGGYVAFGGNPKGGKICGKGKIKTRKLDVDDGYFVKELKFNLFSVSQMCDKKNNVLFTDTECLVLSLDFKLPDESQVLLKVPRENNMYNVNLKHIVPSGDLTCLFAKATIDESNLWHRKLGHINFKTINKLVKDDYSRFTWVFFLATKNETSPILKTFITGLENQLIFKVKVIKSDNRTEFKNNDLNKFCGMKGIKREFSVPRTPQQNGIAERKNRTLIKAAKTMLAYSVLPIPFWAEAVNTACYVQNRVLVTKPHNQTPYELLHGRTPSISFMSPFSCPVTIFNTLDSLGKFEGKVDEGFLVGYSVNSSGPTWLFDIDSLTKTMNKLPVTAGNQSNPSAGFQDKFDAKKAREEINQQYVLFPMWSSGSINPQNFDEDAIFDGKEPDFDAKKPESEVNISPSNSAQSRKQDDNTKKEAKELDDIASSNDEEVVGVEADFNNLETSITEELLQFKMQKVWVLVDLPHGKTAIGTKWVFRNKKDERGIVIRNKAILVTQGYTQEEGIDYEEVFAPEEFYVCQPPGFEDPDYPDKVYKVVKALYVKQNKDGIFISQDKYVAEILRKFGLQEGKSASTPIDTEKPLLKDPDDSPFDLVAYSDSDYAEAEYVAAASCCAQVLWIQNQLLDNGEQYQRYSSQRHRQESRRSLEDILVSWNGYELARNSISPKGATKDSLGKFEGKVDEGFLVGYSVNSKAFRVFNSRTHIVQETLHVNFLENKPNIAGSGPTWLFNIDSLTRTMNYQLVTAGNQTNPSACFQDKFDAEKAREEIDKQYVLFSVWSFGSTNPQNNNKDAAFDGKEPDFDAKKPEYEVNVSLSRYRDLSAEFEDYSDNNINEVNAAGTIVPTVRQNSLNITNTFSTASPSNAASSPTYGKSSFIDASQLPDDPDMPGVEDITYSDDEDDVGAEADFNNLETSITVSPIPTTRVHKDHPVSHIIGDLSSTTQKRSMTRVVKDQGRFSQMFNDDFHTYMFACFLSQKEPKKVHQALKDPSWIEAMQEELLQFKMQKVWVLVDLPHGKRAIGTKWVFRNKKDERGIVIRNKARLVVQGHTQEERIDYEEVFAPVARIEAIRLLLAYASFMGFMVYQMDVKSAILYGTIEEKVYGCQPLGFEDLDYPDKVYKVVKALYGLHQAPRAWYETLANYLLENGFQRGKRDQTLFIKRQKGDILLVQIYVDDIIFGATNKDLCKSFEKLMKDKFQMSSMGELTFFSGLQVKQKKDGIFISQDKYVDKILRKFRLTEGKSASTLIDTEKPLLKDPDGEDVDVHTYRSMIDSLMYLTSSRPDIMFAGVDCLPNEEIFAELARIGYEKPSTKLTFYKAFFLCQWKFLIHTILQCMSAKGTSWNEFSSSMASAVICLSSGDLSTHTTKYTFPALTQKVFANMRRVGKGFSGVETPLFEGMLVDQEGDEEGNAYENVEEVNAGDAAEGDDSAAHGEVLTITE